MPDPLSIVYCSTDDLRELLSAEAVDLRLDDDEDGTLEPIDDSILVRAINQATARVNRYCRGRYDPEQLAQSWEVNEWTTIIAARWLCTRRCQSVPRGIAELYDECVKAMELVKSGQHAIEDIGGRNVDWPAWSNSRVDQRYLLRKIRVQRPLSEGTPTQFRRNRDIGADYIIEPS